ncbi:MAG: MFS transporter [Micrococcaceae bacterium]
MKNLLIDLSPLKTSPAFARVFIGGAISLIGAQMTLTVVGVQVYDITDSTMAVALVGTIALIPMILSGLYGGTLVDRFDKRKVSLYSGIITWAMSAGLATAAFTEQKALWIYYTLTTIQQVASVVMQAANSAITPRLLPYDKLAAAAALRGLSMGTGITLGPALGGVIASFGGFGWAYLTDVILFTASFIGVFMLPAIPPQAENKGINPIRSVIDGLKFLKKSPNIKMAFLADIVAMVFGNPKSIFPAVGALVIGGGAVTVGILSSASAIGVFASSLVSGQITRVNKQGQAIVQAVAAYGISIFAFGIVILLGMGNHTHSTSFSDVHGGLLTVAVIVTIISGVADNISGIYRSTIMQAAVPDGMRGRIQGLYMVVVTGGPRAGDFYVGLVASLGLLWMPQLFGGIIIVALIYSLMWRFKSFRDYDARAPQP